MRGVLWLMGLGLVVTLSGAQTSGRAPRSTAPQDDGRIPLSQAVQELAQKFKAQIVLDPTLEARVSLPKATTLEQALDELAAQVPSSTWRKVYTNKLLGVEPKPEQILSAVRALMSIELGGVIMVNPRSATLHSFVANYPAPSDLESTLEQMQPPFNAKPVYVIFNPRPPQPVVQLRGTRLDQFAQLQRQMLELMSRMTPEERRRALEASFQMWMNADPAIRNQMIFEGMRLSLEYWFTLPPEQQREMIEMGRKFFEQYFGGGGSY
ncbi:MAG: hypothetical protein NZ550_03335 [Fimbriimonadales bacterium]|nr:hypothetical protein [Fimbriimonadales bacterium]MDW8051059.1 hypothetical protein [Armatimonadota bacterium]